jgi:hypothetical protein
VLLTIMVRLHSSPPLLTHIPTHNTASMMKYYLDVNFTVHFRERKTMQITPCCLPSDRATLHLTLQKHIHMLEGHTLICISDLCLSRIALQHHDALVSSHPCAKKITLEQWLRSLDGCRVYGRMYTFDSCMSCDCISHTLGLAQGRQHSSFKLHIARSHRRHHAIDVIFPAACRSGFRMSRRSNSCLI